MENLKQEIKKMNYGQKRELKNYPDNEIKKEGIIMLIGGLGRLGKQLGLMADDEKHAQALKNINEFGDYCWKKRLGALAR